MRNEEWGMRNGEITENASAFSFFLLKFYVGYLLHK